MEDQALSVDAGAVVVPQQLDTGWLMCIQCTIKSGAHSDKRVVIYIHRYEYMNRNNMLPICLIIST